MFATNFKRLSGVFGLQAAVFAVAACDIDQTPTVKEAPSASPALAGLSDADYRLGANDRLRIIVFGQPTLTGEYMLDGKGVLAFPLIGNVDANGRTPRQVERALVAKLDPDFLQKPSVSAEVITRRPFYVVGEVKGPGSFAYVTDMTVLQAVSMAGGYTYRARKHTPLIKRVDASGRMVAIEAQPETKIQPGDVVEIKERLF